MNFISILIPIVSLHSTILSTLNPNKAMGPDKIHELVLKNCAKNISKPLSILCSES